MSRNTLIAAAFALVAIGAVQVSGAQAAGIGSPATALKVAPAASENVIKAGGRRFRFRRWRHRHFKFHRHGHGCWFYWKKYKRTGYYFWKKRYFACKYGW